MFFLDIIACTNGCKGGKVHKIGLIRLEIVHFIVILFAVDVVSSVSA